MSVLRLVGNVILAVVLVVVMVAILVSGGCVVLSQSWENVRLDTGATGGSWVSIDNQSIYYRTWGPEDGPQVVLVHGFAVEGSEMWSANAPALGKAGLRVITVDLRGFGYSARDAAPTYTLRNQAALLAKVLNHLRVKQATVVAHGWGSAVAIQLAKEQPQFVGQMFFIAPLAYSDTTPLWQPLAHTPYLGRAAVWAVSSGGPGWTYLRQRDFRVAASSAYLGEAAQFTHILGTIDAQRAMAASPQDSDLPASITTLKVPSLVLLPEQDTLEHREEGRRLARNLPNAELVSLAEAGHYAQVEQSLQVNRLISDFSLRRAR
jgi:pimeloyl-ACP methyl ester carboxylesterase